MVETFSLEFLHTGSVLQGAVLRYRLLDRIRSCADKQGVDVLAFGLGDGELRVVLEGPRSARGNVLRGVKVGTVRDARHWGGDLAWGATLRWEVHGALEEAVAWCHSAPVESGATGPLASPWSSHRDLLGYRRAPFFEAATVRDRVDPLAVHRACGGGDLPEGWPPRDKPRESLSLLLRVAASLVGVLPSDRRCFRLFVHLSRERGWQTRDLAEALMLTGRRVRQLSEGREPLVPVALRALADPRLCRVP